jgi:hypothetical protein
MIYLEPLGPAPKWLFFGVAALFFPFLQPQNAHFLSMFQRFSFNVHAALKTRRVGDSGGVRKLMRCRYNMWPHLAIRELI